MNYKLIVVLIVLFVTIKVKAQYFALSGTEKYILFQQPDSLYKVNKIKSRSIFSIDKSNKKKILLYKLLMDLQGRITSLEYPLTGTEQTQITSFTYNSINKIAAINEVVIKGTPETFIKETPVKNKQVGKKLSLVPRRKFYNYILNDSDGYLQSISRFNDTGKIVAQSVFSDNGLTNTFTLITKDTITAITRYDTCKQFIYQPVYDAGKNGKQSSTNKQLKYSYNAQGVIVKMTAYDLVKKVYIKTSEYNLFYNGAGLLEKVNAGNINYLYEYESYQ